MDFVTQQNRTYDGLRDYNREFILLAEVKAWLNEAQRDLAHRLKLLRKEEADVVPAGNEIPLPADLVEIVHLRFGDQDVRFVDDTDWFDAQDAGVADPYQGPYGRVFEGNIEVYPLPSVGAAYTLRYVYEPVDLAADADVSSLPPELHMRMVHFARSQGYMRLNQLEHASAHLEFYERDLPPSSLGSFRIRPGPMQLGYEPGPFDLDGSHRG